MKVKLISTFPPRKCGVGEHAENQYKALVANGLNPEKIVITDPTEGGRKHYLDIAKEAVKEMVEGDIIHIQFQLMIFGKYFFVPGFNIIPFILYLRKHTKAKIILELHDSPSREYAITKKDKSLLNYYSLIYNYLKNNVDIFIAHSNKGREITIKEWGINEDKVVSLPLGMFDDALILDKEECKKSLNLHNKKVLLVFGYIRATKNYEPLLQAVKELGEDVVLLIVGDIQQEKDLVAYNLIVNKSVELGIDKRVKIKGYVGDEEMPVIFNATDVAITLHGQGSGDFLSSTMAMQLSYLIPTISTSIDSFENMKKEHGCLETFKSTEELIIKLRELLYDQEKINYLKEKSKEYKDKFNWDNIGKQLIKIYSGEQNVR
jgi:glycosyltransferase involved in cell wall biosynthesis